MIAAVARAAEHAGAVAVALTGTEVIRAAKQDITLPVIGVPAGQSDPPDHASFLEQIGEMIRAGADVVSVNGVSSSSTGDSDTAELVAAVREAYNAPLLAGVSTSAEGQAVIAAGAECLSTRLSGSADAMRRVRRDVPDLELLERIVAEAPNRVVAEGRYQTPEQCALAMTLGAYAVIIDAAAVDPAAIVRRFVSAIAPRH